MLLGLLGWDRYDFDRLAFRKRNSYPVTITIDSVGPRAKLVNEARMLWTMLRGSSTRCGRMQRNAADVGEGMDLLLGELHGQHVVVAGERIDPIARRDLGHEMVRGGGDRNCSVPNSQGLTRNRGD